MLAGDTGCGKSTQVPQYLLQSGCDRLAVTQPRRISAVSALLNECLHRVTQLTVTWCEQTSSLEQVSLSRRVAIETHNEFGSKIAHQIRFDSSRTFNTRCIFMTEGVLLRQAVSDRTLSQYDVIVLDEVHERHVSTDLLLVRPRAHAAYVLQLCMSPPAPHFCRGCSKVRSYRLRRIFAWCSCLRRSM